MPNKMQVYTIHVITPIYFERSWKQSTMDSYYMGHWLMINYYEEISVNKNDSFLHLNLWLTISKERNGMLILLFFNS